MPILERKKPLKEGVGELLDAIDPLGFVAGSCARYYASESDKPEYSDLDVFCTLLTDFDKLCQLFTNDNNYLFMGESPNAIKFRRVKDMNEEGEGSYTTVFDVELIKPFQNEYMKTYGSIKEVLGQFDFTAIKAAFVDKDTLYVDQEFESADKRKVLEIRHINCPIAVMQRVIKYTGKGYKITLRELLELFNEWDRRPPEYKARLYELVGMGLLGHEEFIELERMLRYD